MHDLRIFFSGAVFALAIPVDVACDRARGDDATSTASESECYLAFWNVENLFDTEDDPTVALDEEFTPSGAKQWTADRLQRKLDNLSRLIRKMNSGKGPDLIGLAEVENRLVLERLVEKLGPLKRRYEIIHQESPSSRGIDCAILFDATVWNLTEARFHRVRGIDPPTRDIVEAELRSSSGDRLYVFVNHWPSRTHPDSDRVQAAKVLRSRLDQILRKSPNADALVMGDLNDFPDSPSVQDTLQGVADPTAAVDGRFYNSCWPLFRGGEQGTYVYKNKWEVIDQILISPGLLDAQGWHWKSNSTAPVLAADDQLFDPAGSPKPRPSRSFSGDLFHPTGYSDHLPIKSVLVHRNPRSPAP